MVTERTECLEDAIYAAAFVDALRNIYDSVALPERIRQSQREATMIVEMWKKYRQ